MRYAAATRPVLTIEIRFPLVLPVRMPRSARPRLATPDGAAIAAVDNDHSYCFGVHLNFDPALHSAAVQAEVEKNGDLGLPYPHRRFARLWLNDDHDRASARSIVTKRRTFDLPAEIDETYAAALRRDDIESPDAPSPVERLPEYGMQIHGEYTMYGHFFFLKRLLGNVQKWRFFIDQDSGLRAAYLAAFHNEIRDRTADAFYVRIMPIRLAQAHLVPWESSVFARFCKNPCWSVIPFGRQSSAHCRHPPLARIAGSIGKRTR